MNKYLLPILLSIVLLGCSTETVKNNSGLVIRSHESVKSGDVAPIALFYPDGFKSGDKLQLNYNKENVVTYEFQEGIETRYLSLRIRMKQSGNISAKLFRYGKLIASESKYANVLVPARIPGSAITSARHKLRFEDNTIKMVIGNGQSRKNYITQVDIITNVGRVVITPTVLVAEYPYFSVKYLKPVDPGSIDINVKVKLD